MQPTPFGVLAVQTHWPPEHPMEFPQTLPQDPQLLGSV